MSELPNSWVWTTIDDVASTSSGGTPSRMRSEFYGGAIPWVKSGELNDGVVSEVGESITELGLKNSSAKVFSSGTLCIALYGATVGKVGLLAMEAATNQAVCGISPHAQIETRFLFYFLQSQRSALIGLSQGGAQPNISQQIVRSTAVPICARAEQDRIVAEIEKQLTRLDAATAALKRVQANLKRYRASVLKAACEGRLVSTENGAEIYPKSPVIELLAQPLANGRSPAGAREGFKILRLTALQDGGIDMKEWRRGPVSESWIEKLSIKQGDILVSRGNGSKALVGLAGLVGDTSAESEPILFPDTMIRIRLNKELCDARYFVLIWNSRIMRDQIESTARTTAGIHKIAQSDIERFEIPLPSLDVQLGIAAAAEKAFTTLRHTAQALEKLAITSSSMRASILSSAFTGQLVPQDSTDEPASALLERIRAERELKDSSKRNGRAPRRRS